VDALHIAIAVTNQVDYLLTWNCRHLANAALRHQIDHVCREKGYEPIIICTPEEFLRIDMVWQDPIVEEVRKARDAYAKQFKYDLDAIYHDLKAKERQSGRRVVPCPSKREKTPDQQVAAKPA